MLQGNLENLKLKPPCLPAFNRTWDKKEGGVKGGGWGCQWVRKELGGRACECIRGLGGGVPVQCAGHGDSKSPLSRL